MYILNDFDLSLFFWKSFFRAEVLNLSNVDILGSVILCWGGYSVCCTIFGSILDLYLLDAYSTTPPVTNWNFLFFFFIFNHKDFEDSFKIVAPDWQHQCYLVTSQKFQLFNLWLQQPNMSPGVAKPGGGVTRKAATCRQYVICEKRL